jgi:hypothetical protein
MAEEAHSKGPPPGPGWTWRGPGRCVSHFFSVALPWRQSVSDAVSGEFPSAAPPGTSHRRPRRRESHRHIPSVAWMMDAGAVAEICVGAAVAHERHGISHGDEVICIRSYTGDSLRPVSARSIQESRNPGECLGPRFGVAARSSRAGSDSANTGDLRWNWPLPWNWCDSPTAGKSRLELGRRYGSKKLQRQQEASASCCSRRLGVAVNIEESAQRFPCHSG